MNQPAEKTNLKIVNEATATAEKMTVGTMLDKMAPEMAKIMPKYMTPQRMARIVLGEIRKNENLQRCTMESLGAAIMKAAEVGLEPSSTLGHAYLMPFMNSKKNAAGQWVKTWEAELVIGYKGYIVMASRSGIKIHANEICQNDLFDYEEGTNPYIKHKKALTNRGKVIAYYAAAIEKDGTSRFSIMGAEDVLEHAKANSKSYDKENGRFRGPWAAHFHSMAKKTVIKDLMTYLPYEHKDQMEEPEPQQEEKRERKNIIPKELTLDEKIAIKNGSSAADRENELGDHGRFGNWNPSQVY